MLKVILVDDENIQREGIKRHINWQELGMEVVGTAEDGVDALELIRTYQPDILITDIKMPLMNGLELTKKAKQLLPKIKVIIVSGYDEFEYARTAIELNAHAFLLKPINVEKMREQLAKLANICSSEQNSEREFADLRGQFEESLPLLKKKFVEDLLLGIYKDKSIIKKKAEFLNIHIPTENYCVVILDVAYECDQEQREEQKHLFYLNIENQIYELVHRKYKVLLCLIREGKFVLIISSKDEELTMISTFLEELHKNIFVGGSKDLSIGVSNLKSDIGFINEAYTEANIALKQTFYLGSGKIIMFCDIGIKSNAVLVLDDQINELAHQVSVGNTVIAQELINLIFYELTVSTHNEAYVKTLCYHIVSRIHRILYDLNESVENIFGREDILWDKISRFSTIPDTQLWLKNIVEAICKYILKTKRNKTVTAIEAIKKILESRYQEQITIEEISKMVYLTPNYLCNLFKEKTGESIIDYLTKVRMKEAKQLLEDESIKIYEIAEKSGYNSTSYFSIVFKNSFGISPKEYRDKICGGLKG